ncbi:DinB family protein [Deinococcus hopiensis]|uniref:DinB superfamily protein n=1 Tax=Deinococcus hopiensis KR-140 TaxID=695939 RepID=A0A1W1VGF3_9DEIO|nr:DinB family protein [Deinococcus hopiensis]SMB92435.1 DinB superfamily protein [Deinococcus hopiensis KR-140]
MHSVNGGQLAQLREAYPTAEVTAERFREELRAFGETARAAVTHWHTRLPEREWSPAQETEHVIRVNENTGRLVQLLLSDRELRAGPEQRGVMKDGKRQAPPGTEPGAGEEFGPLLERHAQAGEVLSALQPEANPARTYFHPFLGQLDGLDWMRMTTWHMAAHRRALRRGLEQLAAESKTS